MVMGDKNVSEVFFIVLILGSKLFYSFPVILDLGRWSDGNWYAVCKMEDKRRGMENREWETEHRDRSWKMKN